MAAARTVPAAHGLRWLREGLELFAMSPAVWIGISVLFLLMGVVLSAIPFAGMLWTVAIPIHGGGLMLGCHALRHGRPLEVRHLFNGFEQPRVQALAIIGCLYLAGSIAIILPLVVLMVGGTFFSAMLLGANPSPASAMFAVGLAGLFVLIMTAAVLALAMAIWFAPALVVFRGLEAVDAMKISARAAWQNTLAFVMYSLATMVLGAVIIAPLIGAVVLVAARGQDQSGPVAAVTIGGTLLFAVLCMFLLMPAAWGAMYASYRDVFGEDDALIPLQPAASPVR